MEAKRILETALYTDNLDKAEIFYMTVLGLPVHAKEDGRHVFFRCGDGMLLLFNPEATSKGTAELPAHGATGPGHVAFAIEPSEIDAWRAHLTTCGIFIESEVTWPGGGGSIYFRDPAGNSVELATPSLWAERIAPPTLDDD